MGTNEIENIMKILEEKFGHTKFKSSLQKDAVLAAVQGISLKIYTLDKFWIHVILLKCLIAQERLMYLSLCRLVLESLCVTSYQLF